MPNRRSGPSDRPRDNSCPPEGERRFRKLFEEGPLGMAISGLDHRFVEVNTAFCRIMGRAEAEVVGARFDDLTHPDDRPQTDCAARDLVAGRLPFVQLKKRYLRGDGAVVLAKVTVSVIRDRSGAAQYFLAMYEDVSEAQRVEDQLRESERRYRRLIETAEEGVWTLDADGTTTFANAKMAEILGYGPKEMAGRHLFDFMDDEGRRIAETNLERRRRGIREQHDFRFRRKDGTDVWVLMSTSPILDDDGRYVGALGMVTDITALKRADDELRRSRDAAEAANRAKDEFLATLSHELRTPASTILLWANLLKRGGGDEERANAIEVILQAAREQTRLVDDLLDASRVLHGKMGVDRRMLDLAELVRSAVDAIRPAGRDKGVEPRVLALAAAEVLGDASLLRRVVNNLVSNAIKFTPAGGSVTVELRRDGGEACLAVVDSGEGISPAFLPRVFEPFAQADGSTTRRHGGLGLGLSIVRGIVALHGGTVAAHSAGVDRGATLTVRLPLAAG